MSPSPEAVVARGQEYRADKFSTLLSRAAAPIQPIFHFEEPEPRIRLEATTPAKELLFARVRSCRHPCCHILIVSTGGKEGSQRPRRSHRCNVVFMPPGRVLLGLFT